MRDLFLVFDVESIGLLGEGFSVGYVVTQKGVEIESGLFATNPDNCFGSLDDRAWVKEHEVRDKFWAKWIEWRDKGAWLAADCNWPVETSFMSYCVSMDKESRRWNGPYPFIDIGSVLFGAALDPLATHNRRENELPKHNPLADARQSARLLNEVLPKPLRLP